MRRSYYKIRGMRLSDEVWKALNKLKKRGGSWDTYFIKDLRKKGIVIQKANEELCEDEPKKLEIVKQTVEIEQQIVKQKDSPVVQEIMKILYKINPMLNFANKTERSAAQRLVVRLGEEKAIAAANEAVRVHGKPFAPTITTPLQLERDLGKLIAHHKRNQAESKNAITTNPNL